MKKVLRSKFFRFLLVGGIAALVNIVSRYLINSYMRYELAVVVAYLIGMIVAFVLNRIFVFTPSTTLKTHKQFMRFTIVNIVGAAQVWLVSMGLARYVFPRIGFTFHPYDVAHIIGVAIPAFTSYFGHKHFSFRDR